MRRRREYSRMRADETKAEAGANQAGVPAPDIPLQPSFDADNNSHRYRYMEPSPDAALCRSSFSTCLYLQRYFEISMPCFQVLKIMHFPKKSKSAHTSPVWIARASSPCLHGHCALQPHIWASIICPVQAMVCCWHFLSFFR